MLIHPAAIENIGDLVNAPWLTPMFWYGIMFVCVWYAGLCVCIGIGARYDRRYDQMWSAEQPVVTVPAQDAKTTRAATYIADNDLAGDGLYSEAALPASEFGVGSQSQTDVARCQSQSWMLRVGSQTDVTRSIDSINASIDTHASIASNEQLHGPRRHGPHVDPPLGRTASRRGSTPSLLRSREEGQVHKDHKELVAHHLRTDSKHRADRMCRTKCVDYVQDGCVQIQRLSSYCAPFSRRPGQMYTIVQRQTVLSANLMMGLLVLIVITPNAANVSFADVQVGTHITMTPSACAPACGRYSGKVVGKRTGHIDVRWNVPADGGPPADLDIAQWQHEPKVWWEGGGKPVANDGAQQLASASLLMRILWAVMYSVATSVLLKPPIAQLRKLYTQADAPRWRHIDGMPSRSRPLLGNLTVRIAEVTGAGNCNEVEVEYDGMRWTGEVGRGWRSFCNFPVLERDKAAMRGGRDSLSIKFFTTEQPGPSEADSSTYPIGERVFTGMIMDWTRTRVHPQA